MFTQAQLGDLVSAIKLCEMTGEVLVQAQPLDSCYHFLRGPDRSEIIAPCFCVHKGTLMSCSNRIARFRTTQRSGKVSEPQDFTLVKLELGMDWGLVVHPRLGSLPARLGSWYD